MRLFFFLLFLCVVVFSVFAQTGIPENTCIAGTANCDTNTSYGYIPDLYTPVKTIRIKMVLLQRNDGTGNFSEADELLRKILSDISSRLNYHFSHLRQFSPEDNCYDPGQITDARIRWDIVFSFIRNTWYWNNEHEDQPFGCPTNERWWLKEYSDSLHSLASSDQKALLLLCTESDSVISSFENAYSIIHYSKVSCSMVSDVNLEQNSSIHFRNCYADYLDKKMHWRDYRILYANPLLYFDEFTHLEDDNNVYKWFLNDAVLGLAHELGHALQSNDQPSTHTNNTCRNLMNGNVGERDYIAPCQLGQFHRNLTLNSIRKYVKEHPGQYDAEKSVVIGAHQTVKWNSSRKIQGNLILEEGAILEVNCKTEIAGGASIIIKPGAKLVLSNSRNIVANCNSRDNKITIQNNGIIEGTLPSNAIDHSYCGDFIYTDFTPMLASDPVKGLYQLFLPVDLPSVTAVFSVDGKLIFEKLSKLHEVTVDLQNQPPGLYQIRLFQNGKCYVLKAIRMP